MGNNKLLLNKQNCENSNVNDKNIHFSQEFTNKNTKTLEEKILRLEREISTKDLLIENLIKENKNLQAKNYGKKIGEYLEIQVNNFNNSTLNLLFL